ncbi:ARM repeat-containing protein [Metschnikowia bicuspidata var. bicuspidata NRRL YB-4993]|uniref:ARM repeat-containing protein n=1 Tax=Metschnikowia bicuspidata var. bicuspidata NRRL YB-4993 TaxID=869754 RepID=A0A1A0HK20_9ASCO|nr:ARM repeat-containing protein [Metschnikowia bicuspidata var. bicuspidata NRRL YB-4993]OBA24232.1 ARM repeat-containing protein [Metschnikowia bicuspidata var. bicuspidata NRRL YB-4993]
MGKGVKRAAAKGNASGEAKKAKFKPQPVPEPESSSENEATFYESAEDDSDKAASGDESDADELDDLDESSGAESGAESGDSGDKANKADGETKPADPNKKTSAEQHAEQRKLLAERKLSRKAGAEVERIKSLWEKLRVTKPPPPKEIKEKLCNEIWELSKDIVHDLVLKHDASRVVQTLIKHTTKERREAIVRALKGNYYKLATSSYGKYLLVKILHYGTKESRALIVDELHGNLRKLMRHKEGAYVVEDLFVLYSSAQQKQQMIREFWGSEYAVFKDSGKDKTILDIVNESAEKKQLIMTNLSGTIVASIAKGSTGFQILHAAMKDYVTILVADVEKNDLQIRDFIDALAEQFAELVHTQEGAEVASSLIAIANAKERKIIIRSLKAHGKELIKNEYGNAVLITLFMTVDDTVLVHKSFSAELFTPELLPELVQDKFARRPLLYLLKGLAGKYFAPKIKQELHKYEALAYAKTTKKPQEQRLAELQSKALPLIYKSLLATTSADSEPTLAQLLSLNIAAQFVTELVLTVTEDDDVNSTLRPQLVDAIYDITFASDILEDFHLLNKTPFFSRTLKALIQGNEFKWNSETRQLVAVENASIAKVGSEFAVRLSDAFLQDKALLKWVTGQGSFVVLAVFEVLALQNKKKADELRKAVKKLRKDLERDTDNKGAQLLLKTL